MAEEIEVTEVTEKRSKLKIIIPALVFIAGLGAAGYFFVIAPKAAAAEAAKASTTTELELGKIVRLAPITTNLSDGHVLKVGVALQMIAEPKEKELNALVGLAAAGGHAKPDPEAPATMTLAGLESIALDETIMEMTKFTYVELSTPEGRTKAKEQVSEKIMEKYHGDVVDVYFTDFVMS